MLHTDYKFGEVFDLVRQIESSDEKVQLKNIFGNDNGSVTLLSFKAGQELATHVAPAEVLVYVIKGAVEFTMLDKPHSIDEGHCLLMGHGVPHSVRAKTDSKVMLVKIKA